MKWYLKREDMIDMTESRALDYLILAGPAVAAARSASKRCTRWNGVTSAIYVDVLREVQRDAVDRLSHLSGPDGEAGTTP